MRKLETALLAMLLAGAGACRPVSAEPLPSVDTKDACYEKFEGNNDFGEMLRDACLGAETSARKIVEHDWPYTNAQDQTLCLYFATHPIYSKPANTTYYQRLRECLFASDRAHGQVAAHE